jgi:hypothetical protein
MKPNSCACYGSNDIHECYCNLKNNNMSKQTAVEWLQAEIDNKDMGEIPMWVYEFIEQAKAMEKEQIENAYGDGLNAHRTNFCNREEYYNKKFKK